MSSTEITAIFVTHEHFLTASLPNRGLRLSDAMNDTSSDYLCVRDVRVFRRNSDQRVESLDEAVIRKSNVGLAILTDAEHENPDRLMTSFVAKGEHHAFLMVLGYEVWGELHLQTQGDPVSILMREVRKFVPVAPARLSHSGRSLDDTVEFPTVLVNRDFISLIKVEKQAQADGGLSEAVHQMLNDLSPHASPAT